MPIPTLLDQLPERIRSLATEVPKAADRLYARSVENLIVQKAEVPYILFMPSIGLQWHFDAALHKSGQSINSLDIIIDLQLALSDDTKYKLIGDPITYQWSSPSFILENLPEETFEHLAPKGAPQQHTILIQTDSDGQTVLAVEYPEKSFETRRTFHRRRRGGRSRGVWHVRPKKVRLRFTHNGLSEDFASTSKFLPAKIFLDLCDLIRAWLTKENLRTQNRPLDANPKSESGQILQHLVASYNEALRGLRQASGSQTAARFVPNYDFATFGTQCFLLLTPKSVLAQSLSDHLFRVQMHIQPDASQIAVSLEPPDVILTEKTLDHFLSALIGGSGAEELAQEFRESPEDIRQILQAQIRGAAFRVSRKITKKTDKVVFSLPGNLKGRPCLLLFSAKFRISDKPFATNQETLDITFDKGSVKRLFQNADDIFAPQSGMLVQDGAIDFLKLVAYIQAWSKILT